MDKVQLSNPDHFPVTLAFEHFLIGQRIIIVTDRVLEFTWSDDPRVPVAKVMRRALRAVEYPSEANKLRREASSDPLEGALPAIMCGIYKDLLVFMGQDTD